MDYVKVHNKLISRARIRNLPKGTYIEKHHVIPRCLGGTNEKENLVKLTGREHFLIHWLLHRIHPDNKSLAIAFARCSQINRVDRQFTPSSRSYEEAKSVHALVMKKRVVSEVTRKRMSDAKKGRKAWNKGKNGYISKELSEHLSQIRTGVVLSQEHKDKISKKHLGRARPHLRKAVVKLNDDLKVLKTFDSRRAAIEHIGFQITASHFRLECRCGGFYWMYLEEFKKRNGK